MGLESLVVPFVAKLGIGAYQAYTANQKLKGLGAMPSYDITPEQQQSYDRAEQMAKSGYIPAEKAAFQGRMARHNNAAFQRGLSLGGGSLSRALNSAIISQNLGAEQDFAVSDAGLRRSNIRYADSLGQEITNQKNRKTAQQLAYRMLLEENLGAAKQHGINNMFGAISDIPYLSMTNDYLNKVGNTQEEVLPSEPLLGETSLRKDTPNLQQKGLSFGLTKGNSSLYQPSFYSVPQNLSPVYNR